MAGELPDSERLVREVESLRQRVTELESESLDVTRALPETEARLKECQVKFRTLMESVPEMVSRIRPDSTYVYVSPACTRLFGYSPEELLGRRAYDFIHPEDVSTVKAAARRALETGELELGEYRHLTKDGTYVWVETTGRVVVDDWTDIICVVHDIAARKQSEEALRASEELLSGAVEMARLGHWEYDVARELFTFNDHFYRIFRTTARQVSGYTMSPAEYARRFIHPDDRALVGEEIRKAIETTDPNFSRNLEHRVIFGDGTVGHISVRFFIVKDAHGRTVKTYGVNQDITERKRAEEGLRKSEERYRAVLQNQTDAISCIRADGTYVFMNDAFCRLFGKHTLDLVGQKWHPMAVSEDLPHVEAQLRTLSPSNPVVQIENRVHSGSGQVRWMQFVNRGFFDAEGCLTEIQAVGRDITERKQAEEALRKSEERCRAVLEDQTEIICRFQADGTFTFVNEVFCRFYGKLPQDLIGKQWQPMVVLEDLPHIEAQLRTLSASNSVVTIENRVFSGSGQVHWMQLVNRGFFDAEGRLTEIQAVGRDITARRRAELALKESEARYHTLFDAGHDAVFLFPVNADGMPLNFAEVNEMACQMLGYTREELLSMSPSDLIAAEYHEMMRSLGAGLIENGYFRAEWEDIAKDGRRIPVEVSVTRFEINGQPISMAVVRDITERKRAEEALKESENRLRTLLGTVQAGIILQGKDGRITHVNGVAARILGMEPHEALGGTSMDPRWQMIDESGAHVSGDEHPSMITLRTGKPVRNAVRGMFADDPAAARWLLINAEPLFQRDRHEVAEVLITFLDVTEMKCMQEEVRAERDLAESLLNTAQAIVLVLDPEGRIVRFNPYMEAISGYSLAEVRGKDWFSTFLPAEIQNRVRDLFRKVVSGIQTRGNVDAIVAKNGEERLIEWYDKTLTDADGAIMGVLATGQDVTERKRVEKVLVAQRDLALALSHTMGLRETLRLCLETAMNVSGMDCGGIYLRDEASGSLDFAFSVGLSHQFVEVASHYEADSGHTRLVMMGVPVYGRYREMGLDLSATDLAEGLRALAVIPMQHDGRVIGCVNVASHLVDEISVHSRAALEAIAGQVGSAISRSKTEETLSAHKQRLQWLASELSQTEDRERRHIAAYLHDEVGQSLAAVRVKLATWKGMKSSPKRRALLSDIEQLIDRTIDGTRTLTFELSPPILFELGLGPALEWFGETLCEKEGIAFEFLDEGRSGKIEEVLASALYRIVHELLMNAVKHAQARRVSVSLFTDESHIRLAVKDNGIGMERSRYEQVLRGVSGTYGLFSIRERLSHLGGSLEIESNPGEGTRVTVVAPVSYSVSSHEGDLA